MKEIKEKEAHVKKYKYISKTICDICKRDIDDVLEDNYDRSTVAIGAKLGSVYPEGDFRTGYIIDCCSECFENKVMPLLIGELNVEFREYDVEDSPLDSVDFY